MSRLYNLLELIEDHRPFLGHFIGLSKRERKKEMSFTVYGPRVDDPKAGIVS